MKKTTILRGSCLLHGQHPPGSREAAECPLLGGRITPEENARRIERPAPAQEPPESGPRVEIAGGSDAPLAALDDSRTSKTRKRDPASPEPPLAEARRRLWKTNGFGGRPRTSLAEQMRKARDRKRRSRARGPA